MSASADPHTPLRLAAVLAGGGRSGDIAALEPWLAALAEAGRALPLESRVVTVDGTRPGSWSHRVSRRLCQIGGAGETAADWDRGVRFLEQRRAAEGEKRFDLWVLASEVGRQTSGADGLGILEPAALRLASWAGIAIGPLADAERPLGVLGLGYRAWLSGPFLLPDPLLRRLGSLHHPLHADDLLDEADSRRSFAAEAPLEPALRELLLDRARLLRLEAGSESFAAEILNEAGLHLLAARLQSAGAEALDSRLLAEVPSGLDAAGSSIVEPAGPGRSAWTLASGLSWRPLPRLGPLSRVIWGLDAAKFPERTVHGQASRIRLSGWVHGPQAPYEVTLRCGPVHFTTTADELLQPAVEPSAAGSGRGFEMYRALAPVPPGVHEVALEIPSAGVERRLGAVSVSPRFEVEGRCVWPDLVAAGNGAPVAIVPLEVSLLSSFRPAGAEAAWNGAPLEAKAWRWEIEPPELLESGLWRTRLHGRAQGPVDESLAVQSLEIKFSRENGGSILGRWRSEGAVRVGQGSLWRLSRRSLTALDPQTGEATLELAGWCDARVEELELVLDGAPGPRTARRLPVTLERAGAVGIRRFALAEGLAALEPGVLALELRARRGEVWESVQRWTERIAPARPEVTIETLSLDLAPGRRAAFPGEAGDSRVLLTVSGFLSLPAGLGDAAAEGLFARIAERSIGAVEVLPGARTLEGAEAGDVAARHRAFHAALAFRALPAQAAWLELVLPSPAAGGEREAVVWRQRVAVPRPSGTRA